MVKNSIKIRMSFWQRHRWHHVVHGRLKERLAYFFATVRPFRPQNVVTALDDLTSRQHLGSLRAFQIFGPVDLIVRAWLPPTSDSQFKDLLQTSIKGLTVGKEFLAREICHRWYWKSNVCDRLGSALDEITIDWIVQVQVDDPDPSIYKPLVTNHLLIESPSEDNLASIRFFVGIQLGDRRQDVLERVVAFITTRLQNDAMIRYWSLYYGMGDFVLLLKGQVHTIDYFEIGRLSDELGDEFHHYCPANE